jgi:FlaA1/EpsC-like NDP-sugar epimerase
MQDLDHIVDTLLERDVIPPDEYLMADCIRNKSVMVTGAGGSIGTELCHQLVRHQPHTIILFERSEFSLYTIENVLRGMVCAPKSQHCINIVPVLGSITDAALVENIIKRYQVDTVYHSAAYKQVPMLERNVIAGIHNNIFGTLVLAKAAEKSNVNKFIFISTDKAVRPANVMGATKRFAEQILQAMNAENSHTRFSMVRFGNVLGSSGSVLPLFKKQILSGGPVTVTHPEVSRYFMTAEEAAQLVIQAGALARGGEVFVLDMNKPVRIADMARKMIELMGFTICEDCSVDACTCERGISIQYTGLREGEKLSEELLIDMAIAGTSHPKIFKSMEQFHEWSTLELLLLQLEYACSHMDQDLARKTLSEATVVLNKDPVSCMIHPVSQGPQDILNDLHVKESREKIAAISL